MKLIILKNHFKEGLDIIGKIRADNQSSLPILSNFLIETIDNQIKLSSTNLELGITHFIQGKVIETGGLTIPFSIFHNIINNIQSERITLENDGDKLLITTDNYNAKIQGIKKDEFPIIPQINNQSQQFKIPINTLKTSLLSIINAAQISETKPELNSIFLNYQMNNLKLAATDSFRLAEKTLNNTQFTSAITQNIQIIIPLITIQEVARIFKDKDGGEIVISFDNNQISFKTSTTEIISRLIGGLFPEYHGIIPEAFQTEVLINQEQLTQGLKLTGSFTGRLNEVKVIIKENSKTIKLYSSNQILGENEYLVPGKVRGPSLEITFNWRFLLDGLKNINSKEVFLGFNNSNQPAMLKAPQDISYFYILMPIQGV